MRVSALYFEPDNASSQSLTTFDYIHVRAQYLHPCLVYHTGSGGIHTMFIGRPLLLLPLGNG